MIWIPRPSFISPCLLPASILLCCHAGAQGCAFSLFVEPLSFVARPVGCTSSSRMLSALIRLLTLDGCTEALLSLALYPYVALEAATRLRRKIANGGRHPTTIAGRSIRRSAGGKERGRNTYILSLLCYPIMPTTSGLLRRP